MRTTSHFGIAQWADFAREAVDSATRATMESHLGGGCRRCGRLARSFRSVARAAHAERAVPDYAVRAACDQYRLDPPRGASRATRIPAAALFDSRAVATSGARGSSGSSRHLVYNTDRLTLDVRLDFPGPDEPIALVGQLIERAGDPVPDIPAFLLGDDRLLSHSRTGTLGEFQMHCPPTRPLRLCLSIDDARLVEIDLDRAAATTPVPIVSDSILEDLSRPRDTTTELEPREPASDQEEPTMTRLKKTTIALLIAAVLLPASLAQAWDKKNSAKTHYILRGKSGEIAEIVSRHGLTVLETLPESDPSEDIVLVEGAASLTPDQQVGLVLPDEEVFGLESVELATLPEAILDQSTDAILEQSTDAILESLGMQGVYSDGVVETMFSGPLWAGYANQRAAQLIRLQEAHDAGAPGAAYGSGIVAVIDNGVDPDHPMLVDALVPGYDFIAEQAGIPSEWDNLDPLDALLLQQSTDAILEQSTDAILEGQGQIFHLDQSTDAILEQSTDAILETFDLPPTFGHGTLVAGLVRLVAPGVQIMPLRAFDGEGTANIFDIVRAIYFAVDNGAQVINMSFSTETYSAELARAVNYAHRKGVVCVAAAGNRAERVMSYPAALGFAVGVASTDYSDSLSIFSNYGSDLAALSAPGEQLISFYPGGSYAAVYGTSFAAPLVSGTIALLHNTTGNGGIKEASNYFQALFAISEGATFIPSLSSEIGLGRLDIAQTVISN